MLEIDCCSSAGLEHMAGPLKANKCVGLVGGHCFLQPLLAQNQHPKVFYRQAAAAGSCDERYDCILAINGINLSEMRVTLGECKGLLAAKGYIALAELLQAEEVAAFE